MSIDQPPWFKFDPYKFLQNSLIDSMSPSELGGTLRLLCRQWIDGDLTDDMAMLARQSRLSLPELEAAWGVLSQFFPETKPGKRANRDMWRERKLVLKAMRAKQREGRIAAERRWQGHRAEPQPSGSPMPHPNQERDNKRTKDVKNITTEDIASPPSALADPAPSPGEVIDAWDTITNGKLPAAKLNTKRETIIKNELKDPSWFSDFRAACRFLATTPWYQGSNDRQWSATIDYALKPGKATELAEEATQQAALAAVGGKNDKQHHRSATDQRYIAQITQRNSRRAITGTSAPEPTNTLSIVF
jgi:uncharacterized protein YdaU (DUF1376 family)